MNIIEKKVKKKIYEIQRNRDNLFSRANAAACDGLFGKTDYMQYTFMYPVEKAYFAAIRIVLPGNKLFVGTDTIFKKFCFIIIYYIVYTFLNFIVKNEKYPNIKEIVNKNNYDQKQRLRKIFGEDWYQRSLERLKKGRALEAQYYDSLK